MIDNIYSKTISDFENLNFQNLSISAKIEKINEIIKNFPDERKYDICEMCRSKMGDLKKYNNYIEDGGKCSLCFISCDVLNYSILELVEKAEIDIQDYFYYDVQGKSYSGLRKYWNIPFSEEKI